jgi:hypothetical protein
MVNETRRAGPGRVGILLGACVALAACGAGAGAPSASGQAASSGAAGTGDALSSAPSPSPSPTPAVSLARFDRDGLAFDYPAGWSAVPSGLNMHYITILDFVGSGSATAACAQVTPGPSDTFISSTRCSTDLTLGPGQVELELSRQDGPGLFGPIDPSDPSRLEPGSRYVTVGGLPAIASTSTDGRYHADLSYSWTLSIPAQPNSRYSLEAYLRGPGLDGLQAQVEALVASIAYDPPVAALDPANAGQALAAALAELTTGDPTYGCFPARPDDSAKVTITRFPGYDPLRKPLEVTCSTSIAPHWLGLWKVTLTESWTPAADRSAGEMQTTFWLAPDGTRVDSMIGSAPPEIPYLP